MSESPDSNLLNMIKKLEFTSSNIDSSFSERERMILTTTGSIFKKLVEQKEEISESDLKNITSLNEEYLKSLIAMQKHTMDSNNNQNL